VNDITLDKSDILEIAREELQNRTENARQLKERTNWILVSFVVIFVFFCEIINFAYMLNSEILFCDVVYLLIVGLTLVISFMILWYIIEIIKSQKEPTLNLEYLKLEEKPPTGSSPTTGLSPPIEKDINDKLNLFSLMEHYRECCIEYDKKNQKTGDNIDILMKFFLLFTMLVFVISILNNFT
jgi:hypothetical protein